MTEQEEAEAVVEGLAEEQGWLTCAMCYSKVFALSGQVWVRCAKCGTAHSVMWNKLFHD